jgi:hypothetical protein
MPLVSGFTKLADIPIYRTIVVDAKDPIGNINLKDLGVYWAWDETAAQPYWGRRKGVEVTLHGWVEPKNVDWETSTALLAFRDVES